MTTDTQQDEEEQHSLKTFKISFGLDLRTGMETVTVFKEANNAAQVKNRVSAILNGNENHVFVECNRTGYTSLQTMKVATTNIEEVEK